MSGVWPALGALVAAIALVATGGVFAVKAIVRQELARFGSHYVSKELAIERHAEYERRFRALERHPA